MNRKNYEDKSETARNPRKACKELKTKKAQGNKPWANVGDLR